MSTSLPQQASKFSLNELSIVTKTGKLDISKIYEEINVFDSVLTPIMSGSVIINDSIGLSSKLIFDGSEVLLINIGKDNDSESLRLKKAFRIYKQSERKDSGLNSETYVLYFVSDELFFSDQQRINQSFQSTYSGVAEKILLNDLSVPENNLGGIFDVSYGDRKSTRLNSSH